MDTGNHGCDFKLKQIQSLNNIPSSISKERCVFNKSGKHERSYYDTYTTTKGVQYIWRIQSFSAKLPICLWIAIGMKIAIMKIVMGYEVSFLKFQIDKTIDRLGSIPLLLCPELCFANIRLVNSCWPAKQFSSRMLTEIKSTNCDQTKSLWSTHPFHQSGLGEVCRYHQISALLLGSWAWQKRKRN